MTQPASPNPTAPSTDRIVEVDIISDVMCPWCIVGFKQLELALGHTGLGARVRWHPFELNPDMGPRGENIAAHVQRKYGSTPEQSAHARQNLRDVGQALGIAFNFTPDSRIVNSFKCHVLLDFAATQGLQHPLKLALFAAHFTENRDVSNSDVLLEVASETGLARASAEQALQDERFARAVRAQQQVWVENGISGVPTMVFDKRFALTGAQGPQTYAQVLRQVASDAA